MQCPHCFKDDLDDRSTRCPYCTGRIRKTSVKSEASKAVNWAISIVAVVVCSVWRGFAGLVCSAVVLGIILAPILVMFFVMLALEESGYEVLVGVLAFGVFVFVLALVWSDLGKKFDWVFDGVFDSVMSFVHKLLLAESLEKVLLRHDKTRDTPPHRKSIRQSDLNAGAQTTAFFYGWVVKLNACRIVLIVLLEYALYHKVSIWWTLSIF
ncbi:hypothetical protein N8611_01870 [bacterium]|nr:hypothetical protein [bacterium]